MVTVDAESLLQRTWNRRNAACRPNSCWPLVSNMGGYRDCDLYKVKGLEATPMASDWDKAIEAMDKNPSVGSPEMHPHGTTKRIATLEAKLRWWEREAARSIPSGQIDWPGMVTQLEAKFAEAERRDCGTEDDTCLYEGDGYCHNCRYASDMVEKLADAQADGEMLDWYFGQHDFRIRWYPATGYQLTDQRDERQYKAMGEYQSVREAINAAKGESE